ncbi:hypothetical protein [Streptomyces ambofaciens]|uniref:hypothetical protein n=1 Tax=Streptomyces ambofaciens TaxID=1889 RepID=UPI000A43AE50|nr:hypothetical protein [Streptomyces ambofaciens]
MRKRWMRGLVVWGAVVGAAAGAGVAGAGLPAQAAPGPRSVAAAPVPRPAHAAPVPEADLAHHGSATLTGDRVDVRLVPVNHGPSAVPDATVRLRWSVPLAVRQELPDGCARAEERVVLCRTGALAVDGVGERITLRVLLAGAPPEVVLDLDTVWSGGAVDRHRENDRQRVLVLATGDPYAF